MKTKIILAAITMTIGVANNITACEKLDQKDAKFKKKIEDKKHLTEPDYQQLLAYIKAHQNNPTEIRNWLKEADILKKTTPRFLTNNHQRRYQQRFLIAASLLLPAEVNKKFSELKTSTKNTLAITECFAMNLTKLDKSTLTKRYPRKYKWLYQCARCASLINAAAEEAESLKK